jgi:hypothetical protein
LSPYRSAERRFGTKEAALEFHAELRDSVPDTAGEDPEDRDEADWWKE